MLAGDWVCSSFLNLRIENPHSGRGKSVFGGYAKLDFAILVPAFCA